MVKTQESKPVMLIPRMFFSEANSLSASDLSKPECGFAYQAAAYGEFYGQPPA